MIIAGQKKLMNFPQVCTLVPLEIWLIELKNSYNVGLKSHMVYMWKFERSIVLRLAGLNILRHWYGWSYSCMYVHK